MEGVGVKELSFAPLGFVPSGLGPITRKYDP